MDPGRNGWNGGRQKNVVSEPLSKYTCENCKKTFDSGWTDEEAAQEFREMFGREPVLGDMDGVVCDDCYRKIVAANGL